MKVQFYKEENFKVIEDGFGFEVPEDWEVVELNKAVKKIKPGGTPKTSIKKYYKNGSIPFVKIEDITISKKYLRDTKLKITELGLNNSNAWLVPPNSLLFAMYGSIGAIAINKIPVATNQAILGIITESTKSDLEFLYYTLLFFAPLLHRQAKQTTQANLTAKIVKTFKIPLPPLEEQQKIAHVLMSIDKAIEAVDEAIAKAERIKKGLMRELLTKGIGHKEFKRVDLNGFKVEIPKEWEVVRLGDTLELCQYGLSVPLKEKGKYPIIRMDEIVNGYVVPNIAKYADIDEETFRNFRLEKGDILFNRTNSYELVGRTGIFLLDGDYVFASYLIRLRPKCEILHPHFLAFYLIYSQNRLKQIATVAVHQANINATNLKNLKIPLPPLEEQRKIAEILSKWDEVIETKKAKKEKLERMKKKVMELLLTGKVRVK